MGRICIKALASARFEGLGQRGRGGGGSPAEDYRKYTLRLVTILIFFLLHAHFKNLDPAANDFLYFSLFRNFLGCEDPRKTGGKKQGKSSKTDRGKGIMHET